MLNGSLRLGLAPEQVRILRQRTEGWAAGLQLVGLSLRGREDRGRYIASFAGDDRQIVDYLVAEVLDRQSPAVQDFLLRTSIAAAPHRSAVRCAAGPQPLRAPARRSWSAPTCS